MRGAGVQGCDNPVEPHYNPDPEGERVVNATSVDNSMPTGRVIFNMASMETEGRVPSQGINVLGSGPGSDMASDRSLTLGDRSNGQGIWEAPEIGVLGSVQPDCGGRQQLNAPCGPPQAWSTPYSESFQGSVAAVSKPMWVSCPGSSESSPTYSTSAVPWMGSSRPAVTTGSEGTRQVFPCGTVPWPVSSNWVGSLGSSTKHSKSAVPWSGTSCHPGAVRPAESGQAAWLTSGLPVTSQQIGYGQSLPSAPDDTRLSPTAGCMCRASHVPFEDTGSAPPITTIAGNPSGVHTVSSAHTGFCQGCTDPVSHAQSTVYPRQWSMDYPGSTRGDEGWRPSIWANSGSVPGQCTQVPMLYPPGPPGPSFTSWRGPRDARMFAQVQQPSAPVQAYAGQVQQPSAPVQAYGPYSQRPVTPYPPTGTGGIAPNAWQANQDIGMVSQPPYPAAPGPAYIQPGPRIAMYPPGSSSLSAPPLPQTVPATGTANHPRSFADTPALPTEPGSDPRSNWSSNDQSRGLPLAVSKLETALRSSARTRQRAEKYDGTMDWADYLKQFEMVAD